MTSELFEHVLKGAVATPDQAAVAHAINHIRQKLESALRAEYRGRALDQERSWAKRFNREADRLQLTKGVHHLRGARGIEFQRRRASASPAF